MGRAYAILIVLVLLAPARADDDEDTPGEITRRQLMGQPPETATKPRHKTSQTAPDAPPQTSAPQQQSSPEPMTSDAPDSPTVSAGGSAPVFPVTSGGGKASSRGASAAAESAASPASAAGSVGSAAAPSTPGGRRASGLMTKMADSLKRMSPGADADLLLKDSSSPGGAKSASSSAPRGGAAAASAAAPRRGAASNPAAKTPAPADEAPKALVKRPDFFRVLPKQSYDALKREVASPGASERPQFKDIRLDGDRDFEWGSTCERLSGDCNPLARGKDEPGYKRNDDVSPETLAAVLDSIDKELAAEEPAQGAASRAPSRLAGVSVDQALSMAGSAERPAVFAAAGPATQAPAREALAAGPEKGLVTGALPAPLRRAARAARGWPLAAALGGLILVGLGWIRTRRDE